MGRPPLQIDADQLEELAATLPSQAAIAHALGLHPHSLARKLLDTPALCEAYLRGREANRTGKRPRAVTPRPAALRPRPVPPPPAPPPLRIAAGTPQERVLLAISHDRRTHGQIAAVTGLTHSEVVETLITLNLRGRVRSACKGEERRYYLAGEEAPREERRVADAAV